MCSISLSIADCQLADLVYLLSCTQCFVQHSEALLINAFSFPSRESFESLHSCDTDSALSSQSVHPDHLWPSKFCFILRCCSLPLSITFLQCTTLNQFILTNKIHLFTQSSMMRLFSCWRIPFFWRLTFLLLLRSGLQPLPNLFKLKVYKILRKDLWLAGLPATLAASFLIERPDNP